MSNYVPLAQRMPVRTRSTSPNRSTLLRYGGGGLAVVLVILALYYFVWYKKDPRLTGSCGVVVDGSGSSTASGFDAKKDINAYVDDFLYDTNCRYVTFAPIDTSSEASKCTAPVVDMDPDDIHNGQTDVPSARKANRADAVKAAEGVYDCIQGEPQPHYSDVLGGLTEITQERPSETGPYTVLVISDFGQASKDVSVYTSQIDTASGRSTLIAEIKKDGIMPNLAGIDIRTLGYGVLFATTDPAKSESLDAFWREVILTDARAKSFQKYINK